MSSYTTTPRFVSDVIGICGDVLFRSMSLQIQPDYSQTIIGQIVAKMMTNSVVREDTEKQITRVL